MYAQAYFLENEICHQKCQFPFIGLTKLPMNNDNVMFPYVLVSLRPVYIVIVPYIYIVTLVNPLYFLFLWFLWYIALDFVHLSIFCDQIL